MLCTKNIIGCSTPYMNSSRYAYGNGIYIYEHWTVSLKYEKPLTLIKARSVKLRISCVKTNWIGMSWKTGVSSFMSNTCIMSGTVVAKPLPSMSRASTVNLYSTIKGSFSIRVRWSQIQVWLFLELRQRLYR